MLRSGQNYDGWTGVTLNAPVIVMAGHKIVKLLKILETQNKARQTVQPQLKLLIKKQSDQGFSYLAFKQAFSYSSHGY